MDDQQLDCVEVLLQRAQAAFVETQRQWSDKAILRTTPALLCLFSIVTLWAHGLSYHSSPTESSVLSTGNNVGAAIVI
jgi:hypothetical protein